MIVNRRTFIAKRSRHAEALAMAKAELERYGARRAARICTPSIGPFYVLAMEWEFESLVEYEEYWAGWFATPEATESMDKFCALLDSGGAGEIWDLVELE